MPRPSQICLSLRIALAAALRHGTPGHGIPALTQSVCKGAISQPLLSAHSYNSYLRCRPCSGPNAVRDRDGREAALEAAATWNTFHIEYGSDVSDCAAITFGYCHYLTCLSVP